MPRIQRSVWAAACAAPFSSGIYAYPGADALRTAKEAIESFITEHDIDVTLALF